jgi:tetratricopeptide (TPR) repeat protein
MATKRFPAVWTLFAIALWASLTSTALAGSIKAFSLREANRLIAEGAGGNEDLRGLGGITRFVGMVFDRESSDVILIGKVRTDQPGATLDDLVVALRCRLKTKEDPLVSIDPVEETRQTGEQKVRFEGGIARTQFGADFLRNDVFLKRYSLDLLKRIAGINSYLKLYDHATKQRMKQQGHSVDIAWLSEEESKRAVEPYRGKAAEESEIIQSRFWFCVQKQYSGIVELDDVFVIRELQLGVEAETISHKKVAAPDSAVPEPRDEIGEQFAAEFTRHFKGAWAEYPEMKRLKILFDLAAIAEGIAHLGKDRPTLDNLIEKHAVESVPTPETFPLVERVGIVSGEPEKVTLVQLSGGLKLEAVLRALQKGRPSALRDAVLRTRPDPRSLVWDLPLDTWEMPNDEPGIDPASPPARSLPDEIGSTVTLQTVVFGPKPSSDPRLIFRGFQRPQAVKPLIIPKRDFNKLDHFGLDMPPLSLPKVAWSQNAAGLREIRWNVHLTPSVGASPSLLFLPQGVLWATPTGGVAPAAPYQFYRLDAYSGVHELTPIPLNDTLQPQALPRTVIPNTSLQEPMPSRIDLPLREAAASRNWPEEVSKIVGDNPAAILWQVPRRLLGHVYLAANRNNEAGTLFGTVAQKRALADYQTWTRKLVGSFPDSAPAHYFYADALALSGLWREAEAEFNSAMAMDPPWLPKSARALVYAARAVQEKAIDRKAADNLRDQAFTDLTELTITAPEVADVHANLGAVAVELLRAAKGAEKAYQRAIQVNRDFALALNGLGCAYYGLGDWDRARTQFEQAVQYPDPALFRMAGDNNLALLAEQAEFYVSANPADLLPQRPDTSPAMTHRVEPSRPDGAVAASQSGREGPVRRPAAQYRPSVPAYQPWSQTYQSYQHQADMMRQQMEVRRTQWETQMRQRYHDIGGITMNMQKALADRGDWPVGTFVTLGYDVFPPRKVPSVQPPQQGPDAHRQKGDFASALAELQITGKPLIVEVVSETATLQVGEQSGAAVHRGDRLRITRVNENWLWVESVEGRQLPEPGWIDRQNVR